MVYQPTPLQAIPRFLSLSGPRRSIFPSLRRFPFPASQTRAKERRGNEHDGKPQSEVTPIRVGRMGVDVLLCVRFGGRFLHSAAELRKEAPRVPALERAARFFMSSGARSRPKVCG